LDGSFVESFVIFLFLLLNCIKETNALQNGFWHCFAQLKTHSNSLAGGKKDHTVTAGAQHAE
jgi:hypothetical protein